MSSVTDKLYTHASSHGRRLGDPRKPSPSARPPAQSNTAERRTALYSHPSTLARHAEEARNPAATPAAALARKHAAEAGEQGRKHREEQIALTSKHDYAHRTEVRGAYNGAGVPAEMQQEWAAERRNLFERQAKESEFLRSQHSYQKSLLKK